MIPVTKPFLPPFKEYNDLIRKVWERNWLTNSGPLVLELEQKLKDYLQVEHLLYVSNGTIAIQLAIKAFGLRGDIITTPFSYVATTSSILWENCNPIFVDINPATWNIDPNLIEKAITVNTKAILATHVFGNPCNIDSIDMIARKYGLRVIYDGAHSFGSKFKNKSLLSYGDVTATSFHATKIYHSVEGGAVISNDAEIIERISFMRNFGHDGPGKFNGVGINGKNSELHAAMGILNLSYFNRIIAKRKQDFDQYNTRLDSAKFLKQVHSTNSVQNYSYYPIVLESENVLLQVEGLLNQHNIFPRRYFYPGLHELPYIKYSALPVTEDIAKRILCLPTYYDLKAEEIDLICDYVMDIVN